MPRPFGQMYAIEPNPVGSTLADWLYSGRDFANKAEIPVLGGLGDILFGEAPEVIEDWAYGFPPYSGSGQTTQLDPRMVDVAGLPLPYAGSYYGAKGLYHGAKKLDDVLGRISPTPDDYGFAKADDIVSQVRNTPRHAPLDDTTTFAGAPEETVTLYRASSPTTKFDDIFDAEGLSEYKRPDGMVGDRYTDDYDYADYFKQSYGPDAEIEAIQVPKSVAEAGNIGPGEYIINKQQFVPHVGEKINEGRRQFLKDMGLTTAGTVAATKSPAFLESVLKGVGSDAGRVVATTAAKSIPYVTTELGKAIAYFKVYPHMIPILKEKGLKGIVDDLGTYTTKEGVESVEDITPLIKNYEGIDEDLLIRALADDVKIDAWSDYDPMSPFASESLQKTLTYIDSMALREGKLISNEGIDMIDDAIQVGVHQGLPPKVLLKEIVNRFDMTEETRDYLLKMSDDPNLHKKHLIKYIGNIADESGEIDISDYDISDAQGYFY